MPPLAPPPSLKESLSDLKAGHPGVPKLTCYLVCVVSATGLVYVDGRMWLL